MAYDAGILYINDTNPPQFDLTFRQTNPPIPGQNLYDKYEVFYTTDTSQSWTTVTTWTSFESPQSIPAGDLATGFVFRYIAPIQLINGTAYNFKLVIYDSSSQEVASGGMNNNNPPIVTGGVVNFGGGGIECIVEGMCVRTPGGDVPIETLRPGDIVITSNNREVKIIKRNVIVVSKTTKQTAPYVIEKNAFGINNPPKQLCISPRHAIQIAENLWEIPREAACDNKYVHQMELGQRVTYYHLGLPNYATDTLIVNGQQIESLNDGKVVESYIWNAEYKGYVRHLKLASEIKKCANII